MTIADSKLAQLESITGLDIVSLMNEWGYIVAPAPDEKHRDNLWWAGFMTQSGVACYGYGQSADEAVREAAINTIKEFE